jgi:hypothetical protein
MKTMIAAALVSGIALAGCTRVIERPVPTASGPSVVTTPAISERIVERGSAAAAGGTAAPAACTWASQSYSSGGMSCQDHSQFRCNSGTWERTALSC